MVSVFGSAAKYDNYSIFTQADVAFAFEVPFKLCLQKKAENEVPINHVIPMIHILQGMLPMLTSCNYFEKGSTGSLSVDVVTLSCALVLHRHTLLSDLVKLIAEARAQLQNISQVLSYLSSMSFICMSRG